MGYSYLFLIFDNNIFSEPIYNCRQASTQEYKIAGRDHRENIRNLQCNLLPCVEKSMTVIIVEDTVRLLISNAV